MASRRSSAVTAPTLSTTITITTTTTNMATLMSRIMIITTSYQTTTMDIVGRIITRVMASNITGLIAVTAPFSAFSLADRTLQAKRRHPGLLHHARHFD